VSRRRAAIPPAMLWRILGAVAQFLVRLLRGEVSIGFVPGLNEGDYDDERLAFEPVDGGWSRPGKFEAVSHFAPAR
jgi:hypothetical protein